MTEQETSRYLFLELVKSGGMTPSLLPSRLLVLTNSKPKKNYNKKNKKIQLNKQMAETDSVSNLANLLDL